MDEMNRKVWKGIEGKVWGKWTEEYEKEKRGKYEGNQQKSMKSNRGESMEEMNRRVWRKGREVKYGGGYEKE